MNGIIPIIQIDTDITSALSTNDLEKIATQDYRQMSAYLMGKIPAQALLSTEELHIFHAEQQQEVTAQPLSAKKLVVVLKATRLCNLRCTYCHSWAEGPNQTMRFDILVRTIRKILAIPNIKRFEFVWHGGEVTLLNPLFFQKLLWLQQQFKQPEQHITNSMQSNAVNISDEWLAFIKGIGMHVGISLDGIPAGGEVDGNYITYAEFISFLDRAFTLWWDEYRTVLHIPQFSDFIRAIKNPGTRLAACYWSENCSQEVITLEPNGDVSPCDKYVGDAGSHYGSLMKTDLAELLACSAHNQVAKREEQEAFNKMRQCRWFSLCHGGCPHDRVINRRHVAGYQDNCCGTGKLLATIEGCLNKESQATPKTEDNPHSPSGIA